MNLKDLYPEPRSSQQTSGIGAATNDTCVAEGHKTEPPQDREFSRNLQEQTSPGPLDVQTQAEMERLLGSDELVYGYVYQDGKRTEHLFQGTPENIARFIGSRPYVDEMIITDSADWPILNTIGYFIDKCPNQELLDEIKKTLIPIQKGEAQARPFFCPTLGEVEEYCAQRGPTDMDEGREMDTGINIDPDLGF